MRVRYPHHRARPPRWGAPLWALACLVVGTVLLLGAGAACAGLTLGP